MNSGLADGKESKFIPFPGRTHRRERRVESLMHEHGGREFDQNIGGVDCVCVCVCMLRVCGLWVIRRSKHCNGGGERWGER